MAWSRAAAGGAAGLRRWAEAEGRRRRRRRWGWAARSRGPEREEQAAESRRGSRRAAPGEGAAMGLGLCGWAAGMLRGWGSGRVRGGAGMLLPPRSAAGSQAAPPATAAPPPAGTAPPAARRAEPASGRQLELAWGAGSALGCRSVPGEEGCCCPSCSPARLAALCSFASPLSLNSLSGHSWLCFSPVGTGTVTLGCTQSYECGVPESIHPPVLPQHLGIPKSGLSKLSSGNLAGFGSGLDGFAPSLAHNAESLAPLVPLPCP